MQARKRGTKKRTTPPEHSPTAKRQCTRENLERTCKPKPQETKTAEQEEGEDEGLLAQSADDAMQESPLAVQSPASVALKSPAPKPTATVTAGRDVDHPLTKSRKDIKPGQKYFHCPFCDKAKEVMEGTKGQELLVCVTTTSGHLPVDQNVHQNVRWMGSWKKMRKHCLSCCTLRVFKNNPCHLREHTVDTFYIEQFLPIIFRRRRRKNGDIQNS